MTQTFAFQEPVCELGQGVFPGPNMMPSWKHPNATFNLLPNDHAGHKRRRSFSAMPPVAQDLHMYDADDLQEPNRRLSNGISSHFRNRIRLLDLDFCSWTPILSFMFYRIQCNYLFNLLQIRWSSVPRFPIFALASTQQRLN